jgi:hypothetical protein
MARTFTAELHMSGQALPGVGASCVPNPPTLDPECRSDRWLDTDLGIAVVTR